MAGSEGKASQGASWALNSHDTALCWIPPKEDWASYDRLRNAYDKAYEKWPPHMNFIYPFVGPESLPQASEAIIAGLKQWSSDRNSNATTNIRLGSSGVFEHRNDNTIYLCDNDVSRKSEIGSLRTAVLRSLSQGPSNNFQMHMTIGQSQDVKSDSHHFLLQKTSLLPVKEWKMDRLHIMMREKTPVNATGKSSSRMVAWGTIDLNTLTVEQLAQPSAFYNNERARSKPASTMAAASGDDDDYFEASGIDDELPQLAYTYNKSLRRWVVAEEAAVASPAKTERSNLTVASYNVLAEFFYPVSFARYPVLLRNILDKGAASDILALQEVTDDFLTYLLNDDNVRSQYPYVSHGPPHQDDLEPLSNHVNMVVLSKFFFTWKRVSFQRRHKSAIVAQFPDFFSKAEAAEKPQYALPLIVAVVHLTCGLTDGSVTAKKLELQAILNYLRDSYTANPWILTGDFNISTSAHTIDMARRKGAISQQTVTYLRDLETRLFDASLVDAWAAAKIQRGDGGMPAEFLSLEAQNNMMEVFEGEEGATFNPLNNDLAADIVGNGFNRRPQRYDRILVKGNDKIHVSGFNMFGQRVGTLGPKRPESETKLAITDLDTTAHGHTTNNATTESLGSDHWGVRCTLSFLPKEPAGSSSNSPPVVPLIISTPSRTLNDVEALKACLSKQNVLPDGAATEVREKALQLLKEVVLQGDADSIGQPAFVMVPVGSYGLGVWTSASDVDCLCIGPISSRVFFSLAIQRIRRAEQQQRYLIERDGNNVSSIRIIRKVNANSGTMLELEILGVKMDLQYCASAFIAETWPHATRVAPTDPVFQLSSQALAKLKPMRDLYYLRRTIPDYAAFKMAYHLIKLWAKRRGIYSSKFGYLGGIHLSIMLSRVCKMVFDTSCGQASSVSATTILMTFYTHYAGFDWRNNLVFDPFFHTESASGRALRYVRTAREPLAILGWHGPALNVATAASPATTNTIAVEFQLAAQRLFIEGMTWSEFIGSAEGSPGSITSSGSEDFLKSFKSYVKIEAQFWGVSLAKGTGFIGWLESRCTMLLVDLDRRVPRIQARIWPARYVEQDATTDNDTAERDYKGYYLIGLELNASSTVSKDERKLALGALQTALDKFETQIRGDEKYFDAKSCWMSASVVSQQDLGSLKLDDREWGAYTIGDEEDDDDEEEEEEEEMGSSENEWDASRSKSNKKQASKKNSLPRRPSYEGKFRSSADVINRLRWDPDLDSAEYIVGYEDRFLGVRERALDSWKSEQTDEEFIPQHRIVYFKFKGEGSGEGKVVWDRRERKDEIFGTGVSSLR